MARSPVVIVTLTALVALTACRKDPQADAAPKPSASSYGFLPEAPSETAPPPPPVIPIPQSSADDEVTPAELLSDTKTLEKLKTKLKAKLKAGTATETDQRLLRAVCQKLGDKSCVDVGKADTELPYASGDRAKLTSTKNALKAKVASGAGTDFEKRLLRGLCRQLGDMSCIN